MIPHSEKDGDLRTWQAQVAEAVNGPVRLTATDDATLSSTDHAFQIGPTSGVNLIADNNGIVARNNGAASPLYVESSRVDVTVSNQEAVRLLQNDPSHRPYISFYGGTNSSRAMYIGYPNTSDDSVYVNADKGDLRLQANGNVYANGTRIWPWEDHATTTSSVHSSFDVTIHRVRSGAGMIYLRGIFTCTTAVGATTSNLNLCTLTGAPASTDSISQGLTILESTAGGNVTPPLLIYNPSTRIIVLSRRPAMAVNDQYFFSGVLYCPQ